MKVISLVPSITETLFDLGLSSDEIVGRTKFCIHPKNLVKEIAVIGGTKNINIEKIKNLQPDLIIANKEENVKEQVEELQKNYKILLTDVATLEDNYYLLKTLGNILGKQEIAQRYNSKIQEIFDVFIAGSSSKPKLKVAYLIWQKPYMTVGADTFIHHLLQNLGFENHFAQQKRYPEISIKDLEHADAIFLSTEPYPFSGLHLSELQKTFPSKKIHLVDGEAFSWYGSHLAKCGSYFTDLVKTLKEESN